MLSYAIAQSCCRVVCTAEHMAELAVLLQNAVRNLMYFESFKLSVKKQVHDRIANLLREHPSFSKFIKKHSSLIRNVRLVVVRLCRPSAVWLVEIIKRCEFFNKPGLFSAYILLKSYRLSSSAYSSQAPLALDASNFGTSPNDASATHLILVMILFLSHHRSCMLFIIFTRVAFSGGAWCGQPGLLSPRSFDLGAGLRVYI